MDYVILAGGLGTRLIKDGYECPKPLVPIFGKPMIGVLIDTLMQNDAEHIYVGANARMQPLIDYLALLAAEGLPVITRPVVTDNSYITLKTASDGIAGRFVAMTCDAVFPPDEFKKYIEFVGKDSEDEAVMGLTGFVEDESPLYAKVSPSGEIVDYKYGGVPFGGCDIMVSAGIYGLSDSIMGAIESNGLQPKSLSDFQRLLATKTAISVMPYEFSIAFDVDNERDRLHAEVFLSRFKS